MMTIISDRANLFNGTQAVMEQSDKDVAARIGRLLLHNPVAANQLLRKYDIATGTATPDELSMALAAAIAENDEQFNYELATLLANPRYSYFVWTAAAVTALITSIGTTLGGGMGLAKSGMDKAAVRDSINGQIRLSYQQSLEAEKARKAQIGVIVLAFLGVITLLVILIIFKPFAKKQ